MVGEDEGMSWPKRNLVENSDNFINPSRPCRTHPWGLNLPEVLAVEVLLGTTTAIVECGHASKFSAPPKMRSPRWVHHTDEGLMD